MNNTVTLTRLTHFGGYELTVITLNAQEGISALRQEFCKEQQRRGQELQSNYTFEQLLSGGDISQLKMPLGKVEWL